MVASFNVEKAENAVFAHSTPKDIHTYLASAIPEIHWGLHTDDSSPKQRGPGKYDFGGVM